MARSIKTKVIISVVVVVLVIIAISSLVMLFNMFFSGILHRHVNIEYHLGVSPREGESLKDVTLMLPFPHHKGKPIIGLLKSMRDRFPEVEIELVKSKYGQMLEVHIPEIKDGKTCGAGGKYEFDESRFLPLPSKRFVLKPRFDITRRNLPQKYGVIRGVVSRTMIYADYKDGTGFVLEGSYEGSEWHWDFFTWHTSGEDFFRGIGCSSVPYDWSYGWPLKAEIKKKGWIKIPVVEI